MKKIKTMLTLLLVAATCMHAAAQTGELLDKLPETKAEFISSEKKVIATCNWIRKHPLDQYADKRKLQYALFLAWVTNSPTVTIEVNSNVLTFTKKNSELLIVFMAGWTRYCLENNYSADLQKGNLAGVRSAIKVYKKDIGLKNDKAMEKIIELEDKGELEKWITEALAKK